MARASSVSTASRLVLGGDDEPGLRRHGHRRFSYTDDRRRGQTVTDAETLARISKLAIPPAWTDVWISPDENTHIQATGRDARGRKQYRYHSRYRSERDSEKFDQLRAFGEVLAPIRRSVEADLAQTGLPHDQVVALVVALLDRTLLRVGNECYVRENGSFGLTTLRDRHADVQGRTLRLHFRGKAAKDCELSWSDARLARLVRRCRDLPGQVLFQWLDEGGRRHPVRSEDVNAYLRSASGLDVTAKTFRTWGATLLAAAGFHAVADTPPALRPDVVRTVIRAVAGELGNTPAVCRRSYVHPGVVGLFEVGSLGELWRERPRSRPSELIAEEHHLVQVLQHLDDRPLPGGPAPKPVDRASVRRRLEQVRERSERSVDEVAAKLRAR